MRKTTGLRAVLILVLGLYGCGGSSDSSDSSEGVPPTIMPDTTTTPTPDSSVTPSPDPSSPLSQGARVLGMDLKETKSVDYSQAYSHAVQLGVREISVSLDWALLEPTSGNYDNSLLEIVDAFYPSKQANLTLVLRPLDTIGPSFPQELVGLDFDNPNVIRAFELFLENLHQQLPQLNASGKLKWLHIGNEIDAYLGQDTERWQQWQNFFETVKNKAKELWGTTLSVSSIVQYSLLTDSTKTNLYLNFLPVSDNAVFTYYPLYSDFSVKPVSSVADDFLIMASLVSDKEIFIQECGYPSSTDANSSEILQADFISAVFSEWDTYKDQISLIDFAWQYDVDGEVVEQWINDYGLSGHAYEAAFRGYLSSLGLANNDGSEKPGMQRLREELMLRNWE